MALVTANEKVWVASDCKTLVKDGDKRASLLLAIKGKRLRDDQVSQYVNADKFFDGLLSPLAPVPDSPKKSK